MPEPANANVEPRTAQVRYMMGRLDGFARVLGLDEAATRRIGDFLFSDADLWRLAASRGLVEDGNSR